MRAMLCLVRLYFMATPLTRGCFAFGVGLGSIGLARQAATGVWPVAFGTYGTLAWYEVALLALPWFGLMLLLAASAPLPLIVERIARGRLLSTLPRGRLDLLGSVALTVGLLACITAAAATMFLITLEATADGELYRTAGRIYSRTLLMSFVDFGLIYTAVWLASKTSGVWRLAGLICVIFSIAIPMRYISGVPPFSLLEGFGLASWVLFAVLLLAGGRLGHALGRRRAALMGRARRWWPAVTYVPGQETALLLGTARPWLIAIGQIVPILVLAVLIPVSSLWLVFLLVFSAIAGAVSSQAGARSRRLWLRCGWTRVEIARRVERAYWRHSLHSLVILLAVFAGLGIVFDIGAERLWLGLALLAVGTASCTYLGLMITRGLGWFESMLAVVTMSALTMAGIAVVHGWFTIAAEILVTLFVLAICYRILGYARWRALDWMRARSA